MPERKRHSGAQYVAPITPTWEQIRRAKEIGMDPGVLALSEEILQGTPVQRGINGTFGPHSSWFREDDSEGRDEKGALVCTLERIYRHCHA